MFYVSTTNQKMSLTSSTDDVFKTNTRFPGSQYIFKNAEKILSIPSPLHIQKIKLYIPSSSQKETNLQLGPM